MNFRVDETGAGKPEEPEAGPEKVSEKDTQAKELADARRLADDYLDRIRRMQAEFENYRKHIDREREETIKYANEKLISELVVVYESLERGAESAKNCGNPSFAEGMQMVLRQFREILEREGLSVIPAVGEKFDPFRHEAVMLTPTASGEDNMVVEELQRGYMLKNRVLRYSKVRVSKKIEEQKTTNKIGEGDAECQK